MATQSIAYVDNDGGPDDCPKVETNIMFGSNVITETPTLLIVVNP